MGWGTSNTFSATPSLASISSTETRQRVPNFDVTKAYRPSGVKYRSVGDLTEATVLSSKLAVKDLDGLGRE